jgi:tRNA(adenine34) deaminase
MSGVIGDAGFMQIAVGLARRAGEAGEVPVGALVVAGGAVIGEGWNRPVGDCDPTSHAEINALRDAGRRLGNYCLSGATLYATLEPCAMCIGAVFHARISRVVFGAWDPKAGACGSVLDLPRESKLTRPIDVFGGVCSEQCADLLRRFFEARRQSGAESS